MCKLAGPSSLLFLSDMVLSNSSTLQPTSARQFSGLRIVHGYLEVEEDADYFMYSTVLSRHDYLSAARYGVKHGHWHEHLILQKPWNPGNRNFQLHHMFRENMCPIRNTGSKDGSIREEPCAKRSNRGERR